MSEVKKRNKICISVASSNSEILLLRRAGETDFRRSLNGVTEFEILTDEEPPQLGPDRNAFSLTKGFFKVEASTAGSPEIELLKKKMSVLNLVRSNMQLTRNAIELKFSDAELVLEPTHEPHFLAYWKFMRAERETLITNILTFENSTVEQLNKATSILAVEQFYNHVVNNINVGIYSVVNVSAGV